MKKKKKLKWENLELADILSEELHSNNLQLRYCGLRGKLGNPGTLAGPPVFQGRRQLS